MTASAQTVRFIWEGMVETDRLKRYYGYLTGRLDRLGNLLNVAVLVFSSGGLAAVLAHFPEWVPSVALALSAASGGLQMIQKYHLKAGHSAEIFRQLGRQMVEWERLWADVYDTDDAEARAAWSALIGRQASIFEGAPGAVPLSESLARRSERESNRFWEEQYASA